MSDRGQSGEEFFGLPIPRGASVYGVVQGMVSHLGRINPYITTVAVVTVLVSVAFKRWWPRFPHMIAGMLVGSAAAAGLNAWFGAGQTAITSLGALRIGFPPLSSPDFSLIPCGTCCQWPWRWRCWR